MLRRILFIFLIFLTYINLFSTPSNFDKINVYESTNDSSLFYVIVGTSFYIQAETSYPDTPTLPPSFVILTCTHTSNINDTIYIKLYQDAIDSKIYKSEKITIVEEGKSNSQLNLIGIKENSGETIYFTYGTKYDSLVVAIARLPIQINNLNFYSNSAYTNILSGSVPLNTQLFIEANGLDGNQYTIDTMTITITGKYDSITLTLIESDRNTGKYRNDVTIGPFSSATLKYIKALNVGDTILIRESISNNTSVIYIQASLSPINFYEIKFKESNYTTNKTTKFSNDEIVYIKLIAEDRNVNSLDTVVIVLKNVNTGDTISKIVQEISSGIYQTNFNLGSYTNKTTGYLRVNYGDTIITYVESAVSYCDTNEITRPELPSIINEFKLYFDAGYINQIYDSVSLNSRIYIEAIGLDENALTIDTFSIMVSNDTKYNETINITLTETGKNTGIYRGYIDIDNYSFSALNKIKALVSGDTIGFNESISNNKKIIRIQEPVEPTTIIKLELKNSSYTSIKTDSLVLNEVLYIEMLAVDASIYTSDRARIIIKNNRTSESIYTELIEVSSGIFRGSITLSDYTSQSGGRLKANYGDSISLLKYDNTVTFNTYYLTVPLSPILINNLNFMNSSYSNFSGEKILPNSVLYVEANGLDGNEKTVDTFSIIVNSYLIDGSIETIYVQLTETGNNTGKYRGQFSISYYTSDYYDVIKATIKGETIVIREEINANRDTVVIDYSTTPQTIISINLYRSSNEEAIEVLNNEEIKAVINAIDLNELGIDTTSVRIRNIRNGDSIILTLNETSNNSGRYEGTFYTDNLTNQTTKRIGVNFGDTIVVESLTDISKQDTIFITIPLSPTNIHSIQLMDNTFVRVLDDYINPNVQIGVRLLAEDRNSNYPDTVNVIVANNAYTIVGAETIILTLKETGNNSGDFRDTFVLDNYTYQILKLIKAYKTGDSILVLHLDSGKSDSIAIRETIAPIEIISINVKTDETYMYNYTGEYTDGSYVYIEVVATDLNPYTKDELEVQAYAIRGSDTTSNDVIHVTLKESEANSNRYRGKFKITDLSNDTIDELKVNFGDTIIVEYDVNDSIALKMTVPKKPLTYNELVFTEANYQEKWSSYIQVNFNDNIYVRFTGTDGNSLTIDTVAVKLYCYYMPYTTDYEYILELKETGRATGIYTGSLLLDVIKSPSQGRMKIRQGSYIVMNTIDTFPYHSDTRVIENAQDTLITATPVPPTVFIKVELKKDATFQQVKLSPIMWDEFLYIEAEADKTTSSNLVEDTIAFIIYSSVSDPSNDTFYLLETGIHSGIYRNSSIEVKNINDIGTQRYSNRLEVSSGEWVTIVLLNPTPGGDTLVFMREVAYTITPTRLKRINVYRDNSYSLESKVSTYMSFEPAYRNFYFEVEAYDIDGTITDTMPYANDMLQDTVMLQLVTYYPNGVQRDSMYVTLLETDISSNIFRNWLDVPFLVEEQAIQANQLEGRRGDTIICYGIVDDVNYRAPVELIIQEYKQPSNIRSVRFYTDATYTQELAGTNLLMEDYVYIQVVGLNSASILRDTVAVNLIRQDRDDTPPGDYSDSITIILKETEVGSEIYRVENPEPIPRIYYFRDDASNYLQANALDTIIVFKYGLTLPTDTTQTIPDIEPKDVTRIGFPQSPTSIFVLNVFTDAGYSVAVGDTGVVAIDATLYLEVRGDAGNNVIMDTTLLIIRNNTKGEQIRVVLREMGPNDGRYRGIMSLKPATNDTLDELGVDLGDQLVIRVYGDGRGAEDTTVSISIPDISYPKIIYVTQNSLPIVINNIKFKDSEFNQTITQLGGKVREKDNLYIEVNAEDANPQLPDYLYVWLFTVSNNVTPIFYVDPNNYDNFGITNANSYLKLKLTESNKNTGKFQGICAIRDYQDTNQKFIAAFQSDSIFAIVRDTADTYKIIVDTISVATNQVLTYITFLNFRTSDYENDWGTYATFSDNLYLMLFGDIGSPVIPDEVEVIVYRIRAGQTTYSDSITIKLVETGAQTGEYRGRLNLAQSPTDVTRYDAVPPIFAIDDGDTLYLKWKDGFDWASPTSTLLPSDSVIITGGLAPISPTQIMTVRITEDNRYIDAVDTESTRILPTDYVWVEVIARDANPLTIDTTAVIAENPGYGESIIVELRETSKAAGEYQGFFKLDVVTNQSLGTLRAGLNDTIIVQSVTLPDPTGWTRRWQIHTIINRPPTKVNSIHFMTSDFNNILPSNVLPNSVMYIQLDGEDAGPNWKDTTVVYVTSNKDTTGIEIVLEESAINSGKYRGTFELKSFSQQFNKYINAYELNDVIVVSETRPVYLGLAPSNIGWWYNGTNMIFNGIQWIYRYDTVSVDISMSPDKIVAVRIKDDATYEKDRYLEVGLNDVLYIEVVGEDKNPVSADTTEIRAVATKQSNFYDPSIINFIEVILRESGPNTSKFRGSFKVTDLTNNTIDELGVTYGDTIFIYSTTDTTVFTSIKVAVLSKPTKMNQLIFTDASYTKPINHAEQVKYGDYLYIKFTGDDGSPFTVDTVAVLVSNTRGDTNQYGTGENQLFVDLVETGKNTGIYTGNVLLGQTKNQIEYWLNTQLNGFIIVEPADTSYWQAGPIGYNQLYGDIVQTATLKTPKEIFSIKLMNSDFSSIKMSPIMWDQYLYIEAEADKLSSSNLLADTVAIIFRGTHDGNNNEITLLETAIHSGIFRNSEIYVKNIADVGITNLLPQRLEVYRGDTVEFISTDPAGYRVTFEVADYISPKRIKKLYLYRDSSYSQYVSDLFVSYEERYKNLYFFAEAWDLDGLSTDTYPYANDELPDTFNLILKNKNGDVIKITMTETGNNTNLYKNTITNDIPFVVETIQPAPAIYAERGETIVVYADVVGTYSGDTYPIELIVQQYKQPTIKAVRFFTNSSYTQELNRLNLNIEDRLYPQVIGEGSASILKDTITVLIKSSSSYGTDTYIRVLLTETEVGSEIYRVTTPELIPLIYYRTDDNYNYIYANKGDTIEVYPEDQSYPRQYPYWDFTYIALPQSPDRTYTINVFTDATYTNSTLYKEVARDAYLYFEVRGDIGNNILIDTTMIALNKMGSNDTIYIELTEIGPAQGVYRGFARLGDVSNITQKILGVNYGDTVIITSLKGVNLAPPLFSPPPVILVVVSNKNPNLINSIRFKNANYSALLSENLLNNGTLSKVLNRTKLYVELNGEDASPLLQEFTTENFVRIFSYNPNYLFQIDAATQKPCIYNKIANETYQLDSTNAINQSEGHISLTLWETDKNTGQYRGDVNLSTVNDTYKVLLKADTGYTIVVWCKDSLGNIYFDTAIVADFEEPKYITSLQFMEADYQNILNREVTFGEVLNIELFGDIANTLLADIAVVEVINLRSGDKVEITLKETGLTTGFYRGIVALSELPTIPTNIYAIPPILNVDGGDTILLQWKKNPQSETDIVKVIVPIPKPPNNIKEIAIYKASDYAIPYGKYEIPINSTLYIQAIEEDTYSNPAVIDTIALYITNDMLVLDTITVILTETTMNSRLYRGVAYLTENITNETQDKIKATFGTKLTFIPYISDSSAYYLHSKVDSAVYYVANLLRPKSINQITFMESDWSRPLIYPPLYGDRLHIQVDGEDANPLFPDKFNLAICSFYRVGSSIVMRADTFLIEMTETDKNSGVYRAELDIFRVSFPTATPPQIKAFSGDSIVVTDTITNKSASIEVKDSLEPNDVQELNFIYPNTEITMLEEEFDLEYIGIEATAFDANYRVRDKINLAVKIYSETNVLKDTKTITLTQIDNTSIFYRHIIKLVEDYTIEQTDTSYTEIKVQRGDTIIIIWSPPVNAPIWADTKILSKKVAVFNPPDEVEIKVYKYINGNRVSLENFNYEFDEGDTLLFEAIETSNSLSSKWVRDTVSIQIITYNPTALQSAPKKYVPLTGGIINTKNYTLTETTKSSKIYRVELFITNDPAKAGDTNVIYGVTSGDVLLVYLEIQSNQLVLSAGRFRPRNEINAGPYPNPYNIKYHKNVPYITFAGVQANSKIKILDSTGKLVIELNENSDRVIEGYKWDLKNEDGNFVSSGIYIYIMTTKDGQKKIGKIGIIR